MWYQLKMRYLELRVHLAILQSHLRDAKREMLEYRAALLDDEHRRMRHPQ
jgi:hypothetical protein